jgi:hypothetical protein
LCEVLWLRLIEIRGIEFTGQGSGRPIVRLAQMLFADCRVSD